jgi:hypothetical protein
VAALRRLRLGSSDDEFFLNLPVAALQRICLVMLEGLMRGSLAGSGGSI